MLEAADELERLREEVAALRADAERFVWWMSDAPKDINDFMRGIREGWTLDQWREYCDAARAKP